MNTKTIALFGATGRSGRPLLKKALHTYQVKVLVRDPKKLSSNSGNLQIIQGDILQKEDVFKTIKDTSLIVSLIGQVKDSPYNLQSEGIKNVIEAMNHYHIKRLISLTGGGVRDPEHDQPNFMSKVIGFIMKNVAGKRVRKTLEDGVLHAEIVKKSGLEWTIVRAPMLNEKPATNHYEVGFVGSVDGIHLTRADLANFIIDEIESNKFIHQMPFVTNGK